jgi:hypothetical protein
MACSNPAGISWSRLGLLAISPLREMAKHEVVICALRASTFVLTPSDMIRLLCSLV